MKKLLVCTLVLVMALSVAGVSLAAENNATVAQDGWKNDALVEQKLGTNDTSIKQKGNVNMATVAQDVGTNEADIKQEGNGNKAGVVQGPHEPTDHWVKAEDAATDASIRQFGNSNSATVDQLGAFYDGFKHTAFVLQDGTSNTATVSQTATRQGATASIWQFGTANEGTINQSGSHVYSHALIKQVGWANQATQTQYTQSNKVSAIATIRQNGNLNKATQNQRHRYENNNHIIVRAFQDGNGNVSNQEQGKETGERYSNVFQWGNSNTAITTQGGNNEDHGDMTARIAQFGDENRSTIEQVQGNNVAFSLQIGTSNTATIKQDGGSSLAQ